MTGTNHAHSIKVTRREDAHYHSSMTSYGGFDSSDVIALSMLGGNLGPEKIENKAISLLQNYTQMTYKTWLDKLISFVSKTFEA